MNAPLIGQPIKRKEDARFLTGSGSFTDDVSVIGQAYAVFVRSPHAHARIRNIDAAAAKNAPGVIAVAAVSLVALGDYGLAFWRGRRAA